MLNGSLVRQVRQQRGLTVLELAELVGVNRSYISLIEGGKRQPKPETVAKIATALGISANALTLDQSSLVAPDKSNKDLKEEGLAPKRALRVRNKTVQAVVVNQPNNGNPLAYSPALILSLVNGWLVEIRTSLCSGGEQISDCQIQGLFREGDIKCTFRCSVTVERVTLQVSQPAATHTTVMHYADLCARTPDLYYDDTKWRQYIWFTEYASLAGQLSLVRNLDQDASVLLLTPQLKGLTQFVNAFLAKLDHSYGVGMKVDDNEGAIQ